MNSPSLQGVLRPGLTPSAIVKHLDQYVVGQDEAKKTIAVAVYTHYRKIGRVAHTSEFAGSIKSNILLIGPTGSGKTLLCETLSRLLGVPFVTADAPSLAQTEFIGHEIEAILQRLLDQADDDMSRAQQGIVFIDEVDKLKAVSQQSRSGSGEGVQNALLKIMEGSLVRLADRRAIDTTHILFICGGAFVGLEQILATSKSFGFIATSNDDNQKILDRLNSRVKPNDLFAYGLIPEFAGRLPIVTRMQPLGREQLVRIMIEPRNALYRQFRELFRQEGVELSIKPGVFEQIADMAIEYKIGARALRGIFEEMVTPALYLIPDRPDIKQVVFSSLFEEARLVGTETKPS